MSKDLLLEVFKLAKNKQVIDNDIISFLESIFPNKSNDVLKVLKRGITKYIYIPSNRFIWMAMGENQEHLIYPKLFCSCQDYYKNVVVNRKREFCKHILAQIISEAFNKYKTITLDDLKFKDILKELKLNI
ncbi:MAG: hypothetical protein ACFFEN_06870 [Candidatus Thorarchaeota archaeon]